MKKIICILIVFLLCFSGCHLGRESQQNVQFYYLRNADNFVYGSSDGVVTYEERDATGYEQDIRYLLTLYLQGPVDETLESPFPAGCKLKDIALEADQISLLLNSNLTTLKGIDMTLACVCLAQTCFSMTNVQSVRIMAESFDGRIGVDQTIHINSLLLEDLPQSSE